ncbi:ATP-binding protein [Rhizobium sp. S95]|uniref:ATP-binding protein n=1 Tax=Ciceribacter sichuanensis TaxID=2949647 RepID=A0AAJ1F4D3_9HYPH|nr:MULTISPECIES: ATP-binding protein [unclassified Ciceribacter]MCM2399269.1 ATP-binding protein [Ciceribacter sp. S95]MCO5956525.1 ATP-binding protein [Ciceribacter sp. S101]
MQVGIDMGTVSGGQPAKLDIEELLATRLLVQGNSGSGKSHLLRRLLEQSAPWVQQVIIDPEGDFVTLSDKYGHVVVDGERTEAELAGIANRIRQHRVSCVLTLEGLDIEQQMRAAAAFLNGMFDAEREYWFPVLVVVDEAQMFAPSVGGDVSEDARKMSLGAMTNLMCRGRKRGLAGVIATQRLAKLAKNVAAEASNFLMGRTFLDIDMARAADLLGMDRRQAEMFRDLKRGNFVALGPALSRRPLPIVIGTVETSARSSSPKLMPLPDAPQDVEDLIFTPDPEEFTRPIVRRAPPAPRPTTDILAELSRSTPAATQPVATESRASSTPEISEEEREERLAAVLSEILADPQAAYRTDSVLYQEFLVRARMRRVPGPPMAMGEFRRRVAIARAGVDEETAASEAWATALSLSAGVSDDLQGVFLLMAKAAIRGEACPSDLRIAKAYGTHSARRARRLLGYFEEQGLVVVHTDFAGKRIVAFPDLQAETQPGDPNATDGGADVPSAAE